MPRRKPARRRVTASSSKPRKVMPFSLILPRSEMNALREIASKEGVSVGTVVRRAIHTAVGSAHPEFRGQMLEAEADAFFDQVAARLPGVVLTNAKRKAFKMRLLGALAKGGIPLHRR